jgi:alpha-mannosidase
MDMDHVAAIALAHWPGAAAVWLDCLRRISRYTGALGKFISFEEYFRDTDMPGGFERFESRDYRTPYLKQAVIRRLVNPISAVVRYWQRRGQLEAIEAIETMTATLKATASESSESAEALRQLAHQIDADSEQALDEGLDSQLSTRLAQATSELATALPKQSGNATRGYLLLNPMSFVRRVGLELPELTHLPAAERPIYAVGEQQESRHAVVDCPPMGFLWVAESSKAPPEKQLPAPLAEENTLRNEFFEAVISTQTGGLGALHEYNARSNRMSQQLAMRLPGKQAAPGDSWSGADADARYTHMQADSVEVTASTAALGEITTRGKLLDEQGNSLAGFTQVYRIWRGSRVLQIEVELDLDDSELRSDGWKSYVAARFAWANEAADLWRGLHQTRVPFGRRKSEAPHYVEIEDGDTASTVLTGGLPYHCRVGDRMLDSLLVVRGESARKFTLGIGVELKHSLLEAMSLTSPLPRVLQNAAPPSPADSSWLFQIDVRRVVATHWEPVHADGRVVGLRVRLLETGGRPAHAKLMAFRPLTLAQRLDFRGNHLADCNLTEGAAEIELAPHQFSEFECRWA